MANSLARNSMLRIPSWGRGNLNTPFSSRLYHSTKPSPSQCRIFNRSPRRERNTNRCPLSGFSPITTCTRSASRSNPQRMSVASTASQMRAACAPSSARKLGSLITPLPPRPPAPALAQRHSLAPPPGSAHCAAVSPPALRSACWPLAHGLPPRTRSRPARRGGPAALPRTCLRRHASPLLRHCACSLAKPPPAAASSTSKSAARTTAAPGRTPPHSARSAPAQKSASATSLAPSCSVLAASLCLPPRHPAQCSTPPRPHKMRFTYRSHVIKACRLIRVWTHEPAKRRRVIAFDEVIQPTFAIAFFAGELVGPRRMWEHVIVHTCQGVVVVGIVRRRFPVFGSTVSVAAFEDSQFFGTHAGSRLGEGFAVASSFSI